MIVHDIATGDLNGDGYSDILAWEYSGKNKPRIFLNSGNGLFNESSYSNINGLQEIINNFSGGYTALAVELFDLNSDGILDIIVGNEIGGSSWDYTYFNNFVSYKIPSQRIYWGMGGAKFDFVAGYTDLPNTSIEKWSNTQASANDSVTILIKIVE